MLEWDTLRSVCVRDDVTDKIDMLPTIVMDGMLDVLVSRCNVANEEELKTQLQELWEHLDSDRDGGVTTSELKVAFESADHSTADDPTFFDNPEGAAKQCVDWMDANSNRKIELWEWLSFFDNMAGNGMIMEHFIKDFQGNVGYRPSQ